MPAEIKASLAKLKIVMIGPSKSGKTSLANFLSEAVRTEDPGGEVRPTRGVRIVEFELSDLNIAGESKKVDIELWDCSGDHRYEDCWPAMRNNSHGVLLVCAPSTAAGASRELELLFNYFVSQNNMTPRQCVVLYNTAEQQDDVRSLNLSPTFSKVSQVPVNTISGGNRLRIDFSNYITSVIQAVK